MFQVPKGMVHSMAVMRIVNIPNNYYTIIKAFCFVYRGTKSTNELISNIQQTLGVGDRLEVM